MSIEDRNIYDEWLIDYFDQKECIKSLGTDIILIIN